MRCACSRTRSIPAPTSTWLHPRPDARLVGERLRERGVKIVNADITGKVHKDRRLLTGDSPLASNNLGKLAAETLLADVAAR